jgi:DNA-directed RNA polymerase subunit omega
VEATPVLDDLKEEGIVNKVGGRFKLSTLIQKRIVMLNAGARALVEVKPHEKNDKLAIVIQEILQDKIHLDTSGQVREGAPTDREIQLNTSMSLDEGGAE